jgi:hypothetical protein
MLPFLALLVLAAPPSVTVGDLPAALRLPMPAGANRPVTVKVSGEPAEVWAAASATDPRRLPLVPAADGWAFNLGDPRLAAAVEGAAQFQVYARYADGRRAESLPIFFEAAPAARPSVTLVRADGAREPLPYGARWVDPAAVDRLEFAWRAPGPKRPVVVKVGVTRIDVTAPPAGPTAALQLKGDVRAAWLKAGELEVTDAGGARLGALRAIPAALDLPGEQARFTVVQRRSEDVPGTHGYVQVRLGDITGGQVAITLRAADGEDFATAQSAKVGDVVHFDLRGQRHVVVVEKLVNMLMGEDHAELTVRRADVAP